MQHCTLWDANLLIRCLVSYIIFSIALKLSISCILFQRMLRTVFDFVSPDTCVIDGETRKIVASDKTKYQQVVSLTQIYERPCPPGTSFQIAVCMCDHDSSGNFYQDIPCSTTYLVVNGFDKLYQKEPTCVPMTYTKSEFIFVVLVYTCITKSLF